MDVAQFDYDLPAELIAQEPAEPRDSARLLVLDRAAGLELFVGKELVLELQHQDHEQQDDAERWQSDVDPDVLPERHPAEPR